MRVTHDCALLTGDHVRQERPDKMQVGQVVDADGSETTRAVCHESALSLDPKSNCARTDRSISASVRSRIGRPWTTPALLMSTVTGWPTAASIAAGSARTADSDEMSVWKKYCRRSPSIASPSISSTRRTITRTVTDLSTARRRPRRRRQRSSRPAAEAQRRARSRARPSSR